MLLNRLSVWLALPLLCSVLYAAPVRIADWKWTDQSGVLHEYNAYSSTDISWDAAIANIEDAWHLATIASREEQDMLGTGLQGVSGEYWVGGFQSAAEKSPADGWSWITGEEWGFEEWAPGEPNDFYGPGSEQHLAVWSFSGADRWSWNDEGCNSNICGFIAERTASVPEPGKLPLLAVSSLMLIGFVRRRKV
jgi:hypothetical protein